MEFRQLSPVIGAEVTGVDVGSDLSSADMDRIREEFDRFHLLLFRDQNVSPEQQKRFAERFAPTVLTHQTRASDGLMFISNREVDAAPGDGTLPFHSDHSYYDEPDTTVLALYALAIPKSGGDTLWANAMHAYEDLAIDLKRKIVGLRASHTYVRKKTGKAWDASQPLARLLPESGKALLFVNKFCKDGIAGLSEREGDELLEQLFAHLYREEFLYRHKWRVHDFVIWDNRVLQHAREDFDPSEERTMRRSTQGVSETVVEAVPQDTFAERVSG